MGSTRAMARPCRLRERGKGQHVPLAISGTMQMLSVSPTLFLPVKSESFARSERIYFARSERGNESLRNEYSARVMSKPNKATSRVQLIIAALHLLVVGYPPSLVQPPQQQLQPSRQGGRKGQVRARGGFCVPCRRRPASLSFLGPPRYPQLSSACLPIRRKQTCTSLHHSCQALATRPSALSRRR